MHVVDPIAVPPPGMDTLPTESDCEICSLSSLRNTLKHGMTRHSGMARARPKAFSYSTDSSAADRKSKAGILPLSVNAARYGFKVGDLQKENRKLLIKVSRVIAF